MYVVFVSSEYGGAKYDGDISDDAQELPPQPPSYALLPGVLYFKVSCTSLYLMVTSLVQNYGVTSLYLAGFYVLSFL